jgi:ParB/RepB/Spo0J family partition protein
MHFFFEPEKYIDSFYGPNQSDEYRALKKSLIEIPVNKILQNPDHTRTEFNERELESLAKTIDTIGLRHPITVYADGEFFVVVSGERRLRAFKILNREVISAFVVDKKEFTTIKISLMENIGRSDLDPFDLANGLERLRIAEDLIQEDFREMLNITQTNVSKILSVRHLCDEVRDIYRANKENVNVTNIREFASKTKNRTPDEQVILFKRVLEINDKRDFIRAIRDGQEVGFLVNGGDIANNREGFEGWAAQPERIKPEGMRGPRPQGQNLTASDRIKIIHDNVLLIMDNLRLDDDYLLTTEFDFDKLERIISRLTLTYITMFILFSEQSKYPALTGIEQAIQNFGNDVSFHPENYDTACKNHLKLLVRKIQEIDCTIGPQEEDSCTLVPV